MNTKVGHMAKGENKGLTFITREFPPIFNCVKPLYRTIRDILFPYRLFIGTPKDPEVFAESSSNRLHGARINDEAN